MLTAHNNKLWLYIYRVVFCQCISEVTLHRAWLVSVWVTTFGQANHLSILSVHQVNSASYRQWDRKWVPAKV